MNHYRDIEGLPISLISERTAYRTSAGPVNSSVQSEDKKSGTTTVGLIGKDFVVLAADQQSTLGHFMADDDAPKVYQITSHVALTLAGALGDSQAMIRFLRAQANLYEVERETKITPLGVSSLLSNALNANRYYPFIFQPIIGGVNNKPELFELTPFGCVSQKKKYTVTGSGTEFALTILDSEYKDSFSEEEAIELAVKAIVVAKNRDIYTGGKSITVVVIDKKGFREVDEKEIVRVASKVKSNSTKKG